ncbi:MAG: FecR domain-containing protein [Bacteroidota bacterium]
MEVFNGDDAFLAKWVADELTEAEEQAFRAHPDYEQFNDLIQASSLLKVPQTDTAQHWKKIKTQHQDQPRALKKERSIVYRRLIMAAAAIAILLISYFFLFPRSMQEISTSYGQQLTHQLPDQSSVQLNARSSIEYHAADFLNNRIVNLEGEAFFEVISGQNFTVKTKEGQVDVLGTSFTVKSRENDFRVACQSGRVMVKDRLNNKMQLAPGERVRITNDQIQPKEQVAVEEIGSWRSGKTRFYSEPLKNVVKALENQFGVRINLTTGHEDKFSGSFIHQDVETAFKMVFPPMELSYRKEADGSYWVGHK